MKKILILLFVLLPCIGQGQIISTIAGTGVAGYNADGIPATTAKLNHVNSVIFDSAGNFFIADGYNNRIRKVNTVGIISTYVGTGVAGYSGDGGLSDTSKIGYQIDMLLDTHGNLIFSDANNNRVRKVNAGTGIITTIAGTGIGGFSGDSALATAAKLQEPGGLAIDKNGNIYVADIVNRRVRKIDTAGIITTYAGTGIVGFSGDGGLADTAKFSTSVLGLTCDTSGNLYIADRNNHRIRKVDAVTHIITTIAGNGTSTYIGSGIPATSEGMNPWGLAFDPLGNLFISDFIDYRVLKIDGTGTIYSIAGTGIGGYNGDDGLADTTELYQPFGVSTDVCGNLYIADGSNNRIRKVTMPPTLTTPTISLSGTITAAVGSTVTVNAVVSSAGSSYLVHWMNDGVEFSETTVPFVTYTKTAAVDTITARIVPTGYGCWDSTTSAGWVVTNSAESVETVRGGEVLRAYPNPVRDVLQVAVGSSSGQWAVVQVIKYDREGNAAGGFAQW